MASGPRMSAVAVISDSAREILFPRLPSLLLDGEEPTDDSRASTTGLRTVTVPLSEGSLGCDCGRAGTHSSDGFSSCIPSRGIEIAI